MQNLNSTQIDRELLSAIAAESLVIVELSNSRQKQRWINAIAKAVVQIEKNPFMTFNLDAQSLTVLGTQGTTYTAADTSCECQAAQNSQPCWHLAAARLIVRYVEQTQIH